MELTPFKKPTLIFSVTHILNGAQTTCCLFLTIWNSTFTSGFPPEAMEEEFALHLPFSKYIQRWRGSCCIKQHIEAEFLNFLARPLGPHTLIRNGTWAMITIKSIDD